MSSTPVVTRTEKTRLLSLDALRGFDMFWILGADALVRALRQMNPSAPVNFLAGQLEHKAWAGLAFYDLIFPLFVFIVGVSVAYSLGPIIAEHGRGAAVKRILRRTAVLLVLGFIYSGGIARGWPDVRLLGVLPRIALAYAGGALLFCFLSPRRLAAVGVALLAGYWALLTFVPVRDIALDKDAIAARLGTPKPPVEKVRELFDQTTTWVTGRYEPGLNLTNHLDFVCLPGAKYDVYWDPEGLLSTLPAIASCLLGVLAGGWMRRSDFSARQKLLRLVAGGAICLALGWLWSVEFPVVKKIWTSSFVLVAGGWSMLLLAAFYYVIDVRGWRGWCQPFVWIGLNPITLYLASNFVGFRSLAARFVGGDVKRLLDTHVTRGTGDLVVVLVGLGLMFLLARFLHQRRIYLRA